MSINEIYNYIENYFNKRKNILIKLIYKISENDGFYRIQILAILDKGTKHPIFQTHELITLCQFQKN